MKRPVAEHDELPATTLRMWLDAPQQLARGLDFREEEDRATFRMLVAEATANLRVVGIIGLVRHLGGVVPPERSRYSANRALAAAWMKRAPRS